MKIEMIKKVTISTSELLERYHIDMPKETTAHLVYAGKVPGKDEITLEFLIESKEQF